MRNAKSPISNHLLIFMAMVTLLILPTIVSAQQRSNTIEGCVVLPNQLISVPAMETGVLTTLNVVDGQEITEKDLLGTIDDHKAQMELFAATTRLQASVKEAENDNAILEAEAALRVATSDKERQYRLLQKNAVTEADYEHAVLAAEHAHFALLNRQYEREIAILKSRVDEEAVRAAEALIARHQIVAPFSGNVFRLNAKQNEWVRAGDPVVEIARMDVLRVEGKIDGDLFNPEELMGRTVTIWAERARGEVVEFQGRITNVSLRQSAGKKYQVRAEVVNRKVTNYWMLNPGAVVSMAVDF